MTSGAQRGLLVALLAVAGGAGAAELVDVSVDVEGKRYTVRSNVIVQAPIEAVYDVLADYDQFERVSSIFKDSRYLERDEVGNGTVFTQMRDCILFFCKTIERTETISVEPPVSIVTNVIPDKSDVGYGRSEWSLKQHDGATYVGFEMQMEPKFWVPPVIGPFFIRRFLADGSADAADRLESYALEMVAESGAAP
ncbi:MAG: SRPBCC family protein [Pseudomonadota bacterium]